MVEVERTAKHVEPAGLLRSEHALLLVALGFFLIGLVRLNYPTGFGFDEKYYVPAAVNLAKATGVFNREHPMLSKEIVALVMAVLGYGPITWRLGSLVFSTLGLVGFARAAVIWTGKPTTGLYTALLLATNFLVLGMARLANPEPFLFGFVGLAAAALARFSVARSPEWLAMAGFLFGCATACKWSAAPILAIALAVYLVCFRRSPGRTLQGLLLLGLLPVAVYFTTFIPGAFMTRDALPMSDWLAMHVVMIDFHRGYFPPNLYNSNWLDWLAGTSAIWGSVGEMDGVWRAHLIALNPLQAPVLAIAGVVGLIAAAKRDWELSLPALIFAFCLAVWAISGRGNQFVYYYMVPGAFASICLAILIERWSAQPVLKALAMATMMAPMIWAWPVLTLAPLAGRHAIERYTWLTGWEVHEQILTYPEDRLEWIDTCLPQPRRCV